MSEQNGPHLASTILPAPSFDFDIQSLVFPVHIKPAPGKPIVIMIPGDDKIGNEFEFNGRKVQLVAPDAVAGTTASRYQPDWGILVGFEPQRLACKWCDGHEWGCDQCAGTGRGPILYQSEQVIHDLLKKGPMIVAVKPYTGNWYTYQDFDWIPQGRIVKILGTIDSWDANMLAYVDRDEVAA